MTKLEWLILSSTADDWESLKQMVPTVREDLPDVNLNDIAVSILDLLRIGYLRQMESAEISLNDLLSAEEYPEGQFWFGMTTAGAEEWERSATSFGFDPPDWTPAYACCFETAKQSGWCDGVSLEVCMAAIKNVPGDSEVQEETIRIEQIESFAAKYYKRIQGGIRITFKLKKR